MKLGELSARLGCILEGDAQIEIHGVAGMDVAGPGEITFLTNPRYVRKLPTTGASAVLVENKVVIKRAPGMAPMAALRSANPHLDFARAMELFHKAPAYPPGIHATAVVSPSAKIGEGSHIGPYCFIDEGVEIGRNAILHSLVTVYQNTKIGDNFLAHSQTVVREGCRLGNRVILQSGVVIGGDGFGFAKRADGSWHKIVQQAPVIIEDDVEIQANSCVDRASVGETRIRRGAKIDDLVLVGHACDVGEDAILCGQVGLAGSTVVGKRCILAGQVGAAGHLEIGEGAIITSQSGVPLDVPAGSIRSGTPDMDNRLWRKVSVALERLPEMQKTVRELSKEMGRIKTAKRKKR